MITNTFESKINPLTCAIFFLVENVFGAKAEENACSAENEFELLLEDIVQTRVLNRTWKSLD